MACSSTKKLEMKACKDEKLKIVMFEMAGDKQVPVYLEAGVNKCLFIPAPR